MWLESQLHWKIRLKTLRFCDVKMRNNHKKEKSFFLLKYVLVYSDSYTPKHYYLITIRPQHSTVISDIIQWGNGNRPGLPRSCETIIKLSLICRHIFQSSDLTGKRQQFRVDLWQNLKKNLNEQKVKENM